MLRRESSNLSLGTMAKRIHYSYDGDKSRCGDARPADDELMTYVISKATCPLCLKAWKAEYYQPDPPGR